MTHTQCSHCGKPVYTGYLCSDCQALRAYQPHLFAADGAAKGVLGRLRIDRNAIFSATLVLTACFVMAVLWPQMKRLMNGSGSANDSSAAVIDQFAKKMNVGNVNGAATGGESRIVTSNNAPRTTSLPPSANADPNLSATTESRPQRAFRPQPTSMRAIAPVGDFQPGSRSTFDAFLASYCGERSNLIGGPVTPTSIMWLPNGTGAIVSIDENGSFRQGTAQYSPQTGWGWILAPESKLPSR
jgi:hypothetical protein